MAELKLLLILQELAEAAAALHAEVEMSESVGICLPGRAASLHLGQMLGRLQAEGLVTLDDGEV